MDTPNIAGPSTAVGNEGTTAETTPQPYTFLIVLDFESTCFGKADSRRGHPEIIEFACLLYDIRKNEIVAEFREYVRPTEMPALTTFCTNLTGIEQTDVDGAVPLATCLALFKGWLSSLEGQFKFSVGSSDCECRCLPATWSDWDLNTCLKNECGRKRLDFPTCFTKWMEVGAVYKRWPKNLYGALKDVGMKFEGRPHCGLHDARNTARLVGKIVRDGGTVKITKSL